MLTPNLLYYGRPEPLPARIPLRAGPLTVIYEAGDLRSVSMDGVEIIRRIYAAVRDHNWDTISPMLTNEQIVATEDSFTISYDMIHEDKGVHFVWHGEIVGQADGTITFAMDGEAQSSFLRNRIGFCVLYPMTCAGLQAQIEHVDGTCEEHAFPTLIAPQLIMNNRPLPVAPFDNLRALSCPVLPDVSATVRFEGDVFEMEDQRNWTDASFKVYCTPLNSPWPVRIEPGTRIAQKIHLSLNGAPAHQVGPAASEPLVISMGDGPGTPLPRLGLSVASHGHPLTSRETERLKQLRLAHLRVDLDLSAADYRNKLRSVAAEALALETTLEIAVFLTDNASDELADLVTALQDICPAVGRWLIFHTKESVTGARWIDLARGKLTSYDPTAPIGAGTNAYFTDINANHPPVDAMDFVAYSLNPQVHAFDILSLTETLAGQAETMTTAHSFVAGRPVHVSPVTLKPRFNPNGAAPINDGSIAGLPDQVDERQSSLYCLAWTLGSLRYLAERGAAGITYYETTGWRGVMEQASGCPFPEGFWSIPGAVYPVYHLFADMAEATDMRLRPVCSSRPLEVDALLLGGGGQRMLLLANFTAAAQQVKLSELPDEIQMRRMNEHTVVAAMESPETFRQQPYETVATPSGATTLTLLPFETVRIDM